MGKILKVDLSSQDIFEKELDLTAALEQIGGKGLGAYLLSKELKPRTDPLSENNVLLFITGPLTGIGLPGTYKTALVTKSPLTLTFLDSLANSFGGSLKSTGYDGIIIRGGASHPVYLYVSEKSAKIVDADFLYGLTTSKCQELLRKTYESNVEVACIGPAGEHRVLFSCVVSGTRAFGRGGAGAVMGSKSLKAIVIAKGRNHPQVSDRSTYARCARFLKRQTENSEKVNSLRKFGTAGSLYITHIHGTLPTRNFQTGSFERFEEIDPTNLVREHYISSHGCEGCAVRCCHVSKTTSTPFIATEGPEYESLWAFGPQCGNSDLNTIIVAEDLCDDYGLDTISTGNIIGFCMECVEKGILKISDFDGINVEFGSQDAILKLIRLIALREKIGNRLAYGVRRFSRHLGADASKLAMEVKGLELPGYDPRGYVGSAVGLAIASRGGCHRKAFLGQEKYGGIDRFSAQRKGRLLHLVENIFAVQDSLIICSFSASYKGAAQLSAELLSSVTGESFDQQDFQIIGDRINNLVRAFNIKEGFSIKDDILPERFYKEPLDSGGSKGRVVLHFKKIRQEYYRSRGWIQGMPTKNLLVKLGLDYLIDESFPRD